MSGADEKVRFSVHRSFPSRGLRSHEPQAGGWGISTQTLIPDVRCYRDVASVAMGFLSRRRQRSEMRLVYASETAAAIRGR